jgi:hypothetical protein
VWVKKHAAKGIFNCLQDIDKYYRVFISHSNPLLDQNEIPQWDVNLLFFQVIPDSIRKKVHKGLPLANQKIMNPLDVDVTLGILRWELNKTDIDAVVRDIDLHESTDGEESSKSDLDNIFCARPKAKERKKAIRFN